MLKPCRLTVFVTDSKLYDYLNENLRAYGVQLVNHSSSSPIPRDHTIVSIGPADEKDGDIMTYGRVAGPFKNCAHFFPAKGTIVHHDSDVVIGYPPTSAMASKASLHVLGQFDPLQRPVEQGKLVFEDEETGLSYGPQPASWAGLKNMRFRGCAGANIQGTVDGPVRVAGPFTTNVHPNARVRGQMEPVYFILEPESKTYVLDTRPPVFVDRDKWMDKSHIVWESREDIERVPWMSAISAKLHHRSAFTRPNYGPPRVDDLRVFSEKDVVFSSVLLHLLNSINPLEHEGTFQDIWNERNLVDRMQREFDIRCNPAVEAPMKTGQVTAKLKWIITHSSSAVCFGFDSSVPQLNYLLQL